MFMTADDIRRQREREKWTVTLSWLVRMDRLIWDGQEWRIYQRDGEQFMEFLEPVVERTK